MRRPSSRGFHFYYSANIVNNMLPRRIGIQNKLAALLLCPDFPSQIPRSLSSRRSTTTPSDNEAAVANDNVLPNDTPTKSRGKDIQNNSMYQIVIKRNRQSMTFREGNPLVFSGAVTYAIKLLAQEATDTTISDSSSSALQPPSIGSFVAVSIASKSSSAQEIESQLWNPNTKKKTRGKIKSESKVDKEIIMNPVCATTPYFVMNGSTTILAGTNHSSTTSSSKKDLLFSQTLWTDATQAQTIGYGVYNPHSMYRVRILCHQLSDPILFQNIQAILASSSSSSSLSNTNKLERQALQTIVRWKLLAAIQCRESIQLPSHSTDTFRLFNGEGDGLSGLSIDVMGMKAAVIMSSAAWVEVHKDAILEVLQQVFQQTSFSSAGLELVWRSTPSRIEQDGYTIPHANHHPIAEDDDHHHEDNDDEPNSRISFPDKGAKKFIVATESNIKYKISPWSGQKTGFYCDQRDNRQMIAALCKNKQVLDLCCYTGGFALSAARGGATHVLGIDSSQDAIDMANENAKINDLASSCNFQRADIAQFMKNCKDSYYDVVILDPPKLAPSVSNLERSARKYYALNRDAIKLVNPTQGGLLLTCTCSGAMTQREGGRFFVQTVQSAAVSAKRQLTLLRLSGAAPCHTQCPAAFPSGAYLTAALFFVSPSGS